jgi:hypothetical protein
MLNFAMVLLPDIPTNVAKATFPFLLLLIFFFGGSFKTQLSKLSVLLGYRLKKDEVERCNMRYIKLTSMSNNTNQFKLPNGFHMEQQSTFFAFPSLL